MDDPSARHALQLKTLLRHVHPAVWRRVRLADDLSIADLHRIIQLLMGWDGDHLHRFLIQGREYGISYDGGPIFLEDAALVRLSRFQFRPTERFLYEYDFGVGWEIEVRVEKVIRWDGPTYPPTCIEGRERSPPDGCDRPRVDAKPRLHAVSSEMVKDIEECVAMLLRVADGDADALIDPDQRRELERVAARLRAARKPFPADGFERAVVNAALRRAFAQAGGSP